ncbi:IQ domain-containing protein E-like, partial [Homarus americanus]
AMSLLANTRHGTKSATMTPETRAPSLLIRQDSLSGRTMRNGKNIDVGGVKPLVSRTEIQCGRPGNVRTNAGKPTYKSQEEQYQEIQELRRDLGELRVENSSLKTRSRRLEEDLLRRDRQIEQLMDPAKNDEARRKLTDKGASLVSSLKLRVSRLEATLKEKEAELGKLQASTKATALNEMKIEAETYYQEVRVMGIFFFVSSYSIELIDIDGDDSDSDPDFMFEQEESDDDDDEAEWREGASSSPGMSSTPLPFTYPYHSQSH